MSFLLLPTAAVVGGLALLAGLLYWMQRLRVRHKELVVPTTLFWRAAVQETRARVFVRRFRHPLAYALLLLIASLLWLAFAEPRTESVAGERAIVFVLDGSAGMAWGDRYERACATLIEQVGRLPDREAEVLLCGGWPRTLLRRGESSLLLERRLEGTRPEACPSSLERVVASLPRDRPTTVVVVGDSPVRAELVPDGWRLLRPGQGGARPPNRGVTALGVSDAASGAWDRVDVLIDAPPGYGVNLESLRDVPARGQEVVVTLPPGDAIAFDDEARIVLPRRSRLRVQSTPELARVFAADPGVELAEDGLEIELAEGHDIVLEGPARSLASAPTGAVEFVDAVRSDGAETPAPSIELRTGVRRRVIVGRELLGDRYNFTRSRAFPLFVALALRWMAGDEEFAAYVAAGEPVPGTEFSPPVVGEYAGLHASLQDPLQRTTSRRDDGLARQGLARQGGAGDPAGWIALLAFALLLVEWYLHRTGRVP